MSRASRLNPTELSVIGIDIGKDVFHIIGFDPSGTIVLRRKIKRLALVATFREASPLHRRSGSLPQRAFCQPHVAPARL